MTYSVSIIIPTYNRKKELERLLKSIKVTHTKPLEVIVVMQGHKYTVPTWVRMQYESKPDMARARNIGAHMAHGDLLLYLDDDCVVCPHIVEKLSEDFTDTTVAAVCGRVMTPGQPVEPKNRHTGRVGFLGNVSGGYSSAVKQQIDTVIGCNMCWRRDVFLRLQGIDERFTGNALREETDLSLRAKKLGYTIIFEPHAVVEHRRAKEGGARKGERRLQWYFDFFSNETYYYLKHFSKLFLPVFWLSKIEWVIRCMFGFGREVSWHSLSVPIAGMYNGVRKYYSFQKSL